MTEEPREPIQVAMSIGDPVLYEAVTSALRQYRIEILMAVGYEGQEAEQHSSDSPEDILKLIQAKRDSRQVWVVKWSDYSGGCDIVCIHNTLKGLANCERNHEKEDDDPQKVELKS